MKYSEKENFVRVIQRRNPSHVCYPPPSKAIQYHGGWPGDLRPSAQCLEWKDAWGVGWRDAGGEVFPAAPAVESADRIDDVEVPDAHSRRMKDGLKRQYESIDRDESLVAVTHPYLLYEKCFNILGAEEFLYVLAADEGAANALLDKVTEFELGIAAEFVRFRPECVNTSDDYGMQDRLAISPEMWRKYFKPRLRRIYDFYRAELGEDVVISHHSCGHVMPILEDFIEIGTTVLNPLQTTANDLEKAAEITRGKLVIAGAIDGQQILPFGTPEEVRAEVFRKMELFWNNGGYLPMPEKMLGVSTENKEAMIEAIKEWSRLHVESEKENS